MKSNYDATFYTEIGRGSQESARAVIPVVSGLVGPASVLDVGCGTGTWLAEWARHGADVLGVDGDYVERAMLQIDPDKFVAADLREPLSLDRKFDLVQCLEVAEHIDEARADVFVESLGRHGDVVLFSAAVPGQGGNGHVNEQWPSYWIDKFASAGFTVYDVIRPRIWTDSRVEVWYRQNTLLFSRERVFDGAGHAPDLVHPGLWTAQTDLWRHPYLLLRGFPGALRAALGERLSRSG